MTERKIFLRPAALLTAVLLLLGGLTGCGGKGTAGRYEIQYVDLFDTVTTLIAYADDRASFDRWAADVHAALLEYHRLYDIYNEYEGVTNLCLVNRKAAKAPVTVDSRILGLLEMGKQAGEETGGKVNVAFGAVLSIWKAYREEGSADPANAVLPSRESLREAAEHIDPADIVIDWDASTVFLADPLLKIDVGAVGKGYAAEQVARQMTERAEEYGVSSALLNLGGNIRAVGGRADGTPWRVGIQDPKRAETGGLLMRVGLDGGEALVTSGDYQRYYTVDGKRYAHIIDPDTLTPPEYVSSVSVLCPDSGRADALSTALFLMPAEQGRMLVESLPDVEAVWVEKDGTVTYSAGFEARILR